ncbi:MAG: MFS transporter [Spirochaetota bacterium]
MGDASLFRAGSEFPNQLTRDQRAVGQRRFRQFLLLNGVSVALLMENMLILYAIRNGASDPVVAVIASFVHLTMPAMVLGKRWVSRFGLSRTMALGWFFRYVSAMLMVLAPLLAALGSPTAAIGSIVAGAFGFAFFRAIGSVANTPLTGEITTPDERGTFISGNHTRVQSAFIVTMASAVVVLRVADALWVYQIIITVGCLVGFYAVTILARVPESSAPSRSARIGLRDVIRELAETPRLRRLFAGWAGGFVSFAVVIPYAMIAVKNGYGLSDYEALSHSLVLVVGSISSALLNGLVADRVGPRPLIIIYVAGLLVVAGFWALAPAVYYPILVGAAFFLAGMCKAGIIIGLGHYFLSAAKLSQRVGAALVMRIGGGAAAGITGSVIGAVLLDVLRAGGLSGLDIYQGYFRIMLVPLAVFVVLAVRLERLSEWRISNVLGLMLSPRDLRALFVLNRLRRSHDGSRAVRDLRTLERIGSSVSEEEIREQLNSPRLDVRLRAIRALRNIDFGQETTRALIDEVEHGQFTTAWVAADVLGESGRREAIDSLRAGLDSDDQILQGRCMTALVQLRDEESYERIEALFETTANPRVAIRGANALASIGGEENMLRVLRRTIDEGLPAGVRDELLTAAASMVGVDGQVYRFLRTYNADKERGVAETLPDVQASFDGSTLSQIESESRSTRSRLRHFPRALGELARRAEGEYAGALRRFLDDYEPRSFSRRLAFCLAIMLARLHEPEWQMDEEDGGFVGPSAR